MSSSCISSGCLDVQTPVKISFLKLHQWPQSDAEFLKLLSVKEGTLSPTTTITRGRTSCHESYVCRQKYLRSYTFSRKETVAQKTMKWINEKKRKKSKEGKKDGLFGMVREVRDRSVSDSCFVFEPVFRCLLSCMIKVDVMDN